MKKRRRARGEEEFLSRLEETFPEALLGTEFMVTLPQSIVS
jgi:hypothetical protein